MSRLLLLMYIYVSFTSIDLYLCILYLCCLGLQRGGLWELSGRPDRRAVRQIPPEPSILPTVNIGDMESDIVPDPKTNQLKNSRLVCRLQPYFNTYYFILNKTFQIFHILLKTVIVPLKYQVGSSCNNPNLVFFPNLKLIDWCFDK